MTTEHLRWLFCCANDLWKTSTENAGQLTSGSGECLPQTLWSKVNPGSSNKDLVSQLQKFLVQDGLDLDQNTTQWFTF